MKVNSPSATIKVSLMLSAALCFGLISCAPKPPAHGTAYLIQIDTNSTAGTDNEAVLLVHTQQVLSKRLRVIGVPGFFEQLPHAQLLIKVPPSYRTNPDAVRQAISAVGRLEFRMVHPENDELVAAGIVDPGYEMLRQQVKAANGSTMERAYLVNKKPERGLTGKYIKRAMVTRNPANDQPEISFEFNPEGAQIFHEVTKQYSPKDGKYYYLAIVLDGRLYSAPRIQGAIPGGRGMITGQFDLKEALALANILENPLDPSHRIIDERTF